jgi:putative cardiolipin synthase
MSVRRAPIGAPTLESAVTALLAAHPGRSGVRLVPDGREAFAQRVRGARLAQRSLDVQTYIWRDDSTGRFLAHELLCAAERGIHVRVLLDDMDARPRQVALEALDRLPKIEVRLFNPFRTRSGWLRTIAEILQRGKRLNHRMHNKTWIADDLVAICGGRNVGNEYFAAADGMNFIDLDVIMLGPAVARAAEEFERYWHSDFAVPIDRLRRYSRQVLHPQNLEARLQASAREAANADFARALEEEDPVEGLAGQTYVWSADVHVVFDDPRKALGKPTAGPSHVLDSMAHEVRAASREVLLISPYFVPGVGGTAALRSLAHQGAAVEVLTNSLAATDVAIVHSGYAKYRRPLLEVGVRLFELKFAVDEDDGHSRFRLGSSRASLHTKAAVIDAERVFVGSFNIDPRSAYLNCEMGVWVRSKRLAEQLRRSFRNGTDPRRSFALHLNDEGRIQWTEHGSDGPITHHREPHASWIRRTIVRMLEALPIESQL